MSNAPDKIAFNANNHTFSMPRITEAGARFEYILNNPAAMLAAGYVPADQVVSVKPLEWKLGVYVSTDDDGGPLEGIEHNINSWRSGRYLIIRQRAESGLYIVRGLSSGLGLAVPRLSQAKLAAQTDHDTLSATTTQPQRLDYFIGFEAGREAAAMVVDECNNEGPYEAIAAAGRIRAIPTPPYKSGHVSLITQPATPDIDAPQNVYSGEMVDAASAELDALRKKYAAACAAADGYKDDLHKALERNPQPAAEVRNAALQEAAHVGPVSCYETRHVTLGDKVRDRILALMTKETDNG